MAGKYSVTMQSETIARPIAYWMDLLMAIGFIMVVIVILWVTGLLPSFLKGTLHYVGSPLD